MQQRHEQQRTAVTIAAVAVALGLTACTAGATQGGSTDGERRSSPPQSSRSQETITPPALPSGLATRYRDGEYTATGWYGSLPSHHDVTLTVEDDTVMAVEITTPAEDETSLGYQQRFATALPEAIVGRNLDDLAVDRLAGSSGCSEGFMNALAKIKYDAAS